MADDKLKKLISDWKEEFSHLKCTLNEMGAGAHTVEYNVLSAEALRLPQCITAATELLISEK